MRAGRVEQKAQEEEDRLRHSRLSDAPPSLPLEQYAGAYEDSTGRSGRVNVRAENGELTLSFAGEGAYCACLEPWHHEHFRLRSKDVADLLGPQFAAFTINSIGRVASMFAIGATFQRIRESEREHKAP